MKMGQDSVGVNMCAGDEFKVINSSTQHNLLSAEQHVCLKWRGINEGIFLKMHGLRSILCLK